MSNKELLRQIQAEAVDCKSDLSTLLRKCVVLATRLENRLLRNWAQWELNGYSEGREVPDYRILDGVHSYGTFLGVGGSGVRDAPLSLLSLPEKLRGDFGNPEIRQSVSAITQFIASAGPNGVLNLPWPPEACELYDHTGWRNDLRLVQADIKVNVGSFAAILDTIRNRVLSFALDLEKLDLGPDEEAPPQVVKTEINQVFHQTIYGGSISNAATVASVSQTTVNVQRNLEALKDQLREVGVPETDLHDLEKAVQADEQEPKPQSGHFGKNVASWLGNLVKKAATGAIKAAPDLIATTAAKALKEFCSPS